MLVRQIHIEGVDEGVAVLDQDRLSQLRINGTDQLLRALVHAKGAAVLLVQVLVVVEEKYLVQNEWARAWNRNKYMKVGRGVILYPVLGMSPSPFQIGAYLSKLKGAQKCNTCLKRNKYLIVF